MFNKLYDFFMINILGRVEFSSLKYFFTGKYYDLTSEDIVKAVAMMNADRYVILIRRKTHLSTYFICLGHWICSHLRPFKSYPKRMGYWSHAALHIEGPEQRLQILEAIGRGVCTSEWWDVLNVDAICLLKPKNIDAREFDNAITFAKTLIGRAYDTKLNIANDEKVSCIEYAFDAILHADDRGMPNLVEWVAHVKNLTPDMMYDSGDFEICLDLRR